MYTTGKKLKLKTEHTGSELPSEIEIVLVVPESTVIHVSSNGVTYESSKDILDAFFEEEEEFTLDTLPKMTLEKLDECLALFDIYAQTTNPLAGLQVKVKLLALKENISKLAGIAPAAMSLLGRKIS